MKLTFIFLTVAFLQVGARGMAQNKVTYSGKNVRLETVFDVFEKQTGYTFFYKDRDLKKTSPVTVELKNTPLQEALTIILKNQPVSFVITGKTIFISEKPSTPGVLPPSDNSPSLTNPPLPIDIHGRVTNENGEPIAGASVKIKGTNIGTSTNDNGEFVLNIPSPDMILVISGVNVETKEVPVDTGKNIAVSVKMKNSPLDQVQIIAYGTRSVREQTGNVTSVKGKDIEKQPVNNPLLALEGRVAGLFITQSSGLPGSGVTVRIEGKNSIANGNDPLYVIDGVPFSSQMLPNLANNLLGTSGGTVQSFQTGGNPLNYINLSDIESIEILKDADATAIYGSRAANGAILITTKRGKSGQSKVEVSYQQGWGKVSHFMKMLNTQQYIDMRKEALLNDGLTADPNSDFDLTLWDTTRYTDWQKELIGLTAKSAQANVNISGGNNLSNYFIGGTYHRETSVFPGSFEDQKGSIHVNLNTSSVNQKFKTQFTGNYLVDHNKLPTLDFANEAISAALAPDAPPLYNNDGSLNWAPSSSGEATWTNPFSYLTRKYNSQTNNLITNFTLSYKLLRNLELRSSLGYTNMQTNETAITPIIASDPSLWATFGNSLRSARYANNNMNSWIVEPQISYSKSILRGRLEVLIGSTFQQYNNDGQILDGNNYSSDQVLEDIKSAASLSIASTIDTKYKYNALFGRLNYDLSNKYLFDLTARRDGSSRFGPGKQFGNFGAIGLGWIFSEESFVKNNLSFLSFGKLKGSYGVTGNDQIPDYQFLDVYRTVTAGVPYFGIAGLGVNRLFNPDLHWEQTSKQQIGIDLGFISNNILLSAVYARNQSSNQIVGYALPSATGFITITSNLKATVQNTSWEFSLNTNNVRGRNFNWTTTANLTIPNNKLIDFANISSSSYFFSFVIGQSITSFPVYHFLGVDPNSGLYQFADSKGNPTTNPSLLTDATVRVNTSPKFYGGIENSLNYRSLKLEFLFQFVKQLGPNFAFGNYPGSFNTNQPIYVLSRWQNVGQNTNVQKYNSDYSLYNGVDNAYYSDFGYTDASYVRLKNLSLSWEIPRSIVEKAHIQTSRLFVEGQNLLTITNYKGMDPENLTVSSIPPLRVIAIGVQLTF